MSPSPYPPVDSPVPFLSAINSPTTSTRRTIGWSEGGKSGEDETAAPQLVNPDVLGSSTSPLPRYSVKLRISTQPKVPGPRMKSRVPYPAGNRMFDEPRLITSAL